MIDPRFACNLPSADVPDRAAQIHSLSERLLSSVRDGARAVFAFPAAAEDDVRAFVREESTCCSFFSFNVTANREIVHLVVEAPDEAAPLVDALAAGFEPDRSRADKQRGLRELASRSPR